MSLVNAQASRAHSRGKYRGVVVEENLPMHKLAQRRAQMLQQEATYRRTHSTPRPVRNGRLVAARQVTPNGSQRVTPVGRRNPINGIKPGQLDQLAQLRLELSS